MAELACSMTASASLCRSATLAPLAPLAADFAAATGASSTSSRGSEASSLRDNRTSSNNRSNSLLLAFNSSVAARCSRITHSKKWRALSSFSIRVYLQSYPAVDTARLGHLSDLSGRSVVHEMQDLLQVFPRLALSIHVVSSQQKGGMISHHHWNIPPLEPPAAHFRDAFFVPRQRARRRAA